MAHFCCGWHNISMNATTHKNKKQRHPKPQGLAYWLARLPVEERWAWLAVAIAALYAVVVGGASEVGLMDARFAQQWMLHGVAGFNPGEAHYGFDTPLWVLLMAVASYIVPITQVPILLNIILMAMLAGLMWRVLPHLLPQLKDNLLRMVVMLFTVFDPMLLRHAALGEGGLLALVCLLAALNHYFNHAPIRAGLALGLMVLAWLDSMLLLPPLFVAIYMFRRKLFTPVLIGALVPTIAWFSYTIRTFGMVVPEGVYADIYSYRHSSWGELGLRVRNTMARLYGLNYGPVGLRLLTTGIGVGFAILAWHKLWRERAVKISIVGGLVFFVYVALIRTDVFVGPLVLPRMVSMLAVAAGIAWVLRQARRKYSATHAGALWGGTVFLWLMVVAATGLHTWSWHKYYERQLRDEVVALIKESGSTPEQTIFARNPAGLALETNQKIYDWFGVTTPQVGNALVSAKGYQPARIITELKPHWVVARDLDVLNMLADGYDIKHNYRFMRQFEPSLEAPSYLQDNQAYVVFVRK